MENILYNELIIRGYSVDVGVVLDRRKDQKVQKEIVLLSIKETKRYISNPPTRCLTQKKQQANWTLCG